MLINEEKAAGNYTVEFNAANLASGNIFLLTKSRWIYPNKKDGAVEVKK